MTHGAILAAQAAGAASASALDAMERIGDEARRVEPIARVRRIERRLWSLRRRYHRARRRGQDWRAAMLGSGIVYWQRRLAYWQERA